MITGILSDTHNNLNNLQLALQLFRERGVTTLVHCGDMTSPDTAAALAGFQVIYTLGNGDIASGEIRHVLMELNPNSYVGMVYRGTIDGVRIAVTHGHLPGQVESLIRSGEHDYVFRGHSHMRQDTTTGHTRLINPGALGGRHVQPRSVCLLDTATGKVEFVDVVP